MTKATNTTKTTSSKATVASFDFHGAYVEVLKARMQEVYSKDTDIALKAVVSHKNAISAFYDNDEDFQQYAQSFLKKARIANKNENKEDFIAVKALVKVNKMMFAIANNMVSMLDGYTSTIGENLVESNKIGSKTMLVCLSKAIVFDELEQTEVIIKRHNCAPTTASTQASSTRMTLHYLNACNVVKNARNDVVTLKDNTTAQNFLGMFLSR
jgi:hypothetical protein